MGKHPSTRAARIRANGRDRHEDTDFFGTPVKKDPFKPNPKSLVFCMASGKEKLCFGSVEAAVKYINLNGQRIKETNGYCPTRAYWCQNCCCWHVTSKPKKYRKNYGRRGEQAPLAVGDTKGNGARKTQEPFGVKASRDRDYE